MATGRIVVGRGVGKRVGNVVGELLFLPPVLVSSPKNQFETRCHGTVVPFTRPESPDPQIVATSPPFDGPKMAAGALAKVVR